MAVTDVTAAVTTVSAVTGRTSPQHQLVVEMTETGKVEEQEVKLVAAGKDTDGFSHCTLHCAYKVTTN